MVGEMIVEAMKVYGFAGYDLNNNKIIQAKTAPNLR